MCNYKKVNMHLLKEHGVFVSNDKSGLVLKQN